MHLRAHSTQTTHAVLWDVHGEECKNYNVLQGHTNAVLDLKWAPDGKKVRRRARFQFCPTE